MVDWTGIGQAVWAKTLVYLPRIAGALAVLIIGWILINIFTRFVDNRMKRRRVDKSLRPFFHSLMLWALRIMLLITVASMLGVQMTSFIAVLGAAGLAVGLALQGSLANFAGGVLILLFKPFKVDEFIDAQGVKGTVTEIRIFHTTLLTPDNKFITVPNGELSNSVVTNYSRMPTRRLDLVFGIGYDDNIDKARKILLKLLDGHKLILRSPKPVVFVKEHADSSVNLLCRFWVKSEGYWDVNFELMESVKKEFDKAKISIPYPQRDVHLYKR